MTELIDNVLMRQKDTLLCQIRDGEIEITLATLDTLFDLWVAHNYHYKGRELCQIAVDRLQERLTDTPGRNWKGRKKLESLIQRARSLGDRYWNAEVAWKAA